MTYLNKQKVSTLQQAAVLADEIACWQKNSFVMCDFFLPSDSSPKTSNMHVTHASCVSTPFSNPKVERQCFSCHKSSDLVA